MDLITYNDFAKIDFRVGKIIKAEEVEGSEKLIRMTVDFGELEKRNILAGLKKWYTPADLKGKLGIFVYNLEPKMMMGEASQGMITVAEDEKGENCVLIRPAKKIAPGAKVF